MCYDVLRSVTRCYLAVTRLLRRVLVEEGQKQQEIPIDFEFVTLVTHFLEI